MDVDLFIKKMPFVVKKLISREAFDNRRSVNQEAIALLEEALVHRVASTGKKRKQVEAMLESYAEPQGVTASAPASTSAQTPEISPGLSEVPSDRPIDLRTSPVAAQTITQGTT